MPARPSPGAVLQISFNIGDEASHEAGSRFFMTYTGGAPSAGDLNTLASGVADAWETDLAGVTYENEALHGVTITDLSSDTGAVGEWTGTKAGSDTGSPLIASAAFVVNHQIDRRYRGGRPRTYLRAGVVGSLATGSSNEWSTGSLAAVLDGWEAWIHDIGEITGVGITLTNIVNVSWYKGNTVFTTPTGRARNIPVLRDTPVVDVIVASSVATKVGSQRRRLDI
jgi:hypothetical protein